MSRTLFTDELDLARKSLEQAQADLNEATRRAVELQQHLVASKDREGEAAAQITRLEVEIEDLKRRASQGREAQGRLAAAETQAAEFQDEAKRERERADMAEVALASREKRLADATDEARALRSRVASLTGELDPTRALVEAVRQRAAAEKVIATQLRGLQ